jgi:hypothetical protein
MKASRGRIVIAVLGVAVAAWYGWHRWRLAHAPYEWSGTVEARTMQMAQMLVLPQDDRVANEASLRRRRARRRRARCR